MNSRFNSPARVSHAAAPIRPPRVAIRRRLRACVRMTGVGWLVTSVLTAALAIAADNDAAEPVQPVMARTNDTTVILVTGAHGEKEYAGIFEAWAGHWTRVCKQAGIRLIRIGGDDAQPASDRERLREALESEPREASSELWIVLIGHGTFDGRSAKFNLEGPDVSAEELAGWLKPFRRPLAVINCASGSAPFLKALSGPNRVVLSATRSGFEQNYARFGEYLAGAVASPEADLDRDGQTSLLEAFLVASGGVVEFYQGEGRLATEHALIDDNGDGQGTPGDWFRGIHAVKKPAQGGSPDGLRAHQFHLVRSDLEARMSPETRARRDELEVAISRLREGKSGMPEADYYTRLESLLLELARLYQAEDAGRSD